MTVYPLSDILSGKVRSPDNPKSFAVKLPTLNDPRLPLARFKLSLRYFVAVVNDPQDGLPVISCKAP